MKILTHKVTEQHIEAYIVDGVDFVYSINRAAFEEFIKDDTLGYTIEDYYKASKEINDAPLHENIKMFIGADKGEQLKYNREKAYAVFLAKCFEIEDETLRNEIIETERTVRMAIHERAKYVAA